MESYRVYIGKQMMGPFSRAELLALEGFSENSLICPVGEDSWLPAIKIPTLRMYFMTKAAKNAIKIRVTPPSTPANLPNPDQSVTRVVHSGDIVGPDHQLNVPTLNPKPLISSASTRTSAVTTMPIAHHIPVPQRS